MSTKANNKTTFICPHCLKTIVCSVANKANHIRWCKKNPNQKQFALDASNRLKRLKLEGKISCGGWNRGKTAETDERIKKYASTRKSRYLSGELIPAWKGKHHTEETKRKQRESALASTHQRITKKSISYRTKSNTIIKLDSSYERMVAEILDKNDIDWVRPGPLVWVDKSKTQHHYFPDFYIPSKNVFLDPKNDYCFIAQKEKIEILKKTYNNIIFLKKSDLTEEHLLNILQ